MIGIVGGCISYSMTNYTLPLQLSSAFFHGLWTWFIAFCLADVFNLLQDTEEDSGRQIESNLLSWKILFQLLYCFAYPRITIKEVTLTATSFSHTPSSTNRIISAILHIYRRFLHLYQRFFIILTIRHRISTYRQFSATYLCSIPCH